MKSLASFRSLFLLTIAVLLSAAAQAQSFRAYLSSAGNDANPCTLVSPCRLLPAALNAVAIGGEIWMLDSANFNSGPVAITKSVTILAIPGAVGSLVALSGNAVNINSAVNVTMRNLVIVPFTGGGGTNGIVITAGSLTLENSVVANLPGNGISATNARVVVSNSSVRNNGGNAGIYLLNGASGVITGSTVNGNLNAGVFAEAGASGTTTADITSVTLSGNGGSSVLGYAPSPGGSVKVSMRDGQLAKNEVGANFQSVAGASSVLSLTNVTASNNQYGVFAVGPGASIIMSATTITYSLDSGVYQANGAVIESGSDNIVRNNGTNVTGTVTPITKL